MGVKYFVLHTHTECSQTPLQVFQPSKFPARRGLSCIHLTVYSLRLKDTGLVVFYSTVFCRYAATRVTTPLSTLTQL